MSGQRVSRREVTPGTDRTVQVQVIATDAATKVAVVAGLRGRAGIELTSTVDRGAACVVVAVAATAHDALLLFLQARQLAGKRLLIVADLLDTAGVLRAVRAGACAILPRGRTGAHDIAAAVHTVAAGDGTMPREMYGPLFEQAGEPSESAAGTLTERELHVLRLVADGYGNAEIARRLDCSQHTIKNVIYDLMSRLRLRNRTHAAAYAVRAGLI